MPKLKKVDISYDQIKELVCQLDFDKKMALINEIVKQKGYKESFYSYTEGLAKKYNIPKMNEEELDKFLH